MLHVMKQKVERERVLVLKIASLVALETVLA